MDEENNIYSSTLSTLSSSDSYSDTKSCCSCCEQQFCTLLPCWSIFVRKREKFQTQSIIRLLDVGSYFPILLILSISLEMIGLGIMSGCGNDSLTAHILFTIITIIINIFIFLYVLMIIRKGFTMKPSFIKFTFIRLIDAFLAVYVGCTFITMCFWVWSQETYISNLGDWSTSVWLVWERCLFTTVLAATVGYARYVPSGLAVELYISTFVIMEVVLYGLLIGAFFAITISRSRKRAREKRRELKILKKKERKQKCDVISEV